MHKQVTLTEVVLEAATSDNPSKQDILRIDLTNK